MRQCKRLLAAVLIVVLYAAFGITVCATEAPASEAGQPGEAGQPAQDGEDNP